MPENREAVTLFLGLETQWRTNDWTGKRIGIDYGVIGAVATMMGITMTPLLFDDLRLMEAAALEVINA